MYHTHTHAHQVNSLSSVVGVIAPEDSLHLSVLRVRYALSDWVNGAASITGACKHRSKKMLTLTAGNMLASQVSASELPFYTLHPLVRSFNKRSTNVRHDSNGDDDDAAPAVTQCGMHESSHTIK